MEVHPGALPIMSMMLAHVPRPTGGPEVPTAATNHLGATVMKKAQVGLGEAAPRRTLGHVSWWHSPAHPPDDLVNGSAQPDGRGTSRLVAAVAGRTPAPTTTV